LPGKNTFNCVVIGPSGKLLDCKTPSVVFPAHDGQVGVWYNHMPMFCKLGLGIVRVARAACETEPAGGGEDVLLLVDGGFVVVCSNLLKVISYDVILPAELKPEGIEQIIAGITKKLSSGLADQHQRQHLSKKLALLQHLSLSSTLDSQSPAFTGASLSLQQGPGTERR
jgi:F0F1-type ATP synthase epsilon subunit